MLGLLKAGTVYLREREVQIAGNIFKLHSRVTFFMLISFSLLLSAKEYFGMPIDCFVGEKDIKSTVDNFCWISGTYINTKNFEGKIGQNIARTGVGEQRGGSQGLERQYQKYYQWMILVFILQALSFYVPSFLWKIWEGRRVNMICRGLMGPMIDAQWTSDRKNEIVAYLIANKRTHFIYYCRFFFCELLNMAIVFANIGFINLLLPDFWWNYMPAMRSLIKYEWDTWDQYSSRVFPKLVHCDLHTYGPSGSLQTRDAMCLLPLNIVNEKIFALIWVWFLVLAIVSVGNVLVNLFIIGSCRLRIYSLQSYTTSLKLSAVRKATRNGRLGDWFILRQLQRNINSIIYAEIVNAMATITVANKKTASP